MLCSLLTHDSAPDEIVFSIAEGSRDNKKPLAELNWFIIFIIFYNDGYYNVIAMMLTL